MKREFFLKNFQAFRQQLVSEYVSGNKSNDLNNKKVIIAEDDQFQREMPLLDHDRQIHHRKAG